MANTDLTRTFAIGTADERKKHTFSAWIKLSNIGSVSNTFFANRPSGNYRFYYMIQNDSASGANQFYCYMVYNGSAMLEATGTRKLRDVNGWYHIVVRTDTTQATGSDRFRVYINGEQETLTFGHTPDQDEELQVNRDAVHNIGEEGNGNGQFDGSMSHIHFCDGYSYAPTEFGETDSTTGEWKIKTSPSVSYGTNGFFILKDGNSVTDQSGNSNNWTVAGGTLTKTEDNPSNVMNSFNAVATYKDNFNPSNWLKNGNTVIDTDGRTDYRWFTDFGTLGATSGKYYMELKINQIGSVSSVNYGGIGIANDFAMSDSPNGTYGRESNDWGNDVYAYAYRFDTRSASGIALIKRENGSSTITNSYQTQASNLQVVMMAWDLDNGKIWFGRENSWFDSGNPSNGTNPALTFTPNGRTFLPYVNHWVHNSGNNPIYSINFGNGYFGTNTVASAGNNASGNGIFEYDTPTGFTALSTKGLNE